MNINYIDEKMSQVLYDVFTSYRAETLQERVESAASGTVTLEDADFPEDLRDGWKDFKTAVTRIRGGDEGSFAASAKVMPDEEAHRVLVDFYNLAIEISSRCEQASSK
jgi:hypothetical protein